MGVDGAEFKNEMHFMYFGAIISSRNGTEGSNFHIWNIVITSIEMSGNRLVSIVTNGSTAVLTKPCLQKSSSFSNIKHATSTSWDVVDEMGGGAREMVFDIILRFRCQNGGGRIYEVTSSTLTHTTRKWAVMLVYCICITSLFHFVLVYQHIMQLSPSFLLNILC